jgi:hypothetical protein
VGKVQPSPHGVAGGVLQLGVEGPLVPAGLVGGAVLEVRGVRVQPSFIGFVGGVLQVAACWTGWWSCSGGGRGKSS